LISDIECESNPHLCEPFSPSTFPRFFWLDFATNTTVRYFGAHTKSDFVRFIARQLDFGLIPFDPLLASDAHRATVFVFSIPTEGTEQNLALLAHANDIANRFRHLDSQFAIEPSNDVSFSVFTAPNRRIVYKGGLYATQIDDFVIRHSVPFLAPLSPTVTEILRYHGQSFFAVVLGSGAVMIDVEMDVAESASNYLPVVNLTCDVNQWLCSYASVSAGQCLVFERKTRRFWIFHGEKTDAGQWTAAVANGTVPPERPGIGVFGWLFEEHADRAAAGLARPPVPQTLSGIILMAVVAALADLVLQERRGSLGPRKRKSE
jgi:hypothetical protein